VALVADRRQHSGGGTGWGASGAVLLLAAIRASGRRSRRFKLGHGERSMTTDSSKTRTERINAILDRFLTAGMATWAGIAFHWIGLALLTLLFVCSDDSEPLPLLPAKSLPAALADSGPLANARPVVAVPADAVLPTPQRASVELKGKRYAVVIVGASRDEVWVHVGDATVVVSQSAALGPPGPESNDSSLPLRILLLFAGVLVLARFANNALVTRVTEGRWGAGALDFARIVGAASMLSFFGVFAALLIFGIAPGAYFALIPLGWVLGTTFLYFEHHDAFRAAVEQLRRPADGGLEAAVPASHRGLLSLDDWDLLARLEREKGDIVRQLIVVGIRPVPQPGTLDARWGPEGYDEEHRRAWDHDVKHNERVVVRLRLCIELGLLVLVANRLQMTLLAREQLALPTTLLLPRIPSHARAQLARATADLQRGNARSAASLCGGILEGLAKKVVQQCLGPDLSPANKDLQKEMAACGIKWSGLDGASVGTLGLVLGELFGDRLPKLTLSAAGAAARTKPQLEFGRTLSAIVKAATPVRNAFAHDKSSIDERSEPVLAFRLLQLTRVFGELVAELTPGEDPPPELLIERNPPASENAGSPPAEPADV
jgi:hypothetical protein